MGEPIEDFKTILKRDKEIFQIKIEGEQARDKLGIGSKKVIEYYSKCIEGIEREIAKLEGKNLKEKISCSSCPIVITDTKHCDSCLDGLCASCSLMIATNSIFCEKCNDKREEKNESK